MLLLLICKCSSGVPRGKCLWECSKMSVKTRTRVRTGGVEEVMSQGNDAASRCGRRNAKRSLDSCAPSPSPRAPDTDVTQEQW